MVTREYASHFLTGVVGRVNGMIEALRASASGTEFAGKAILVSYADWRGVSVLKVFPVNVRTGQRSVTVLVAPNGEFLGALHVSARDMTVVTKPMRMRCARIVNLRNEDRGSLPFGVGLITVELADLETVRRLLLEQQTRVSDAQEVKR